MNSIFTKAIVRSSRARAAWVAVATAAFVGAVEAQIPARYRITEIGSLPASGSAICDCSLATGISSDGTVTGIYLSPPDVARGFIWRNGVTRDIGGPPGSTFAAVAVNDQGVVVGYGGTLAFRAESGQVSDLPTLGGPNSSASDINTAGVVVGEAYDRGPSPRAAKWVGTTVTDLGTLGGIASKALGINENGQIVGWSLDAEANKLAFVWSPESGMTALPFPAPGATLVEAISINNWGLAIGTASVPREVAPSVFRQQTRGYLWSPDGGVIDLGDLNPATDDAILITPAAINDFGLVVGTISGQSTTTPFLWQSGVMRNLNSLVDPAAGWRIVSAKDINNSGQIAASGVHTDGRHRALVLTPIPPGCPADFNDSGTVTVEDLFEFLAAYFESDSRADVNASGAVTVQDIFDYLLVYFAGCP